MCAPTRTREQTAEQAGDGRGRQKSKAAQRRQAKGQGAGGWAAKNGRNQGPTSPQRQRQRRQREEGHPQPDSQTPDGQSPTQTASHQPPDQTARQAPRPRAQAKTTQGEEEAHRKAARGHQRRAADSRPNHPQGTTRNEEEPQRGYLPTALSKSSALPSCNRMLSSCQRRPVGRGAGSPSSVLWVDV